MIFFLTVSFAAAKKGGKADTEKEPALEKETAKVRKFNEILANKLSKEPVIDGALEDVWQEAAKLEKFTVAGKGINPKYPFTVYIGYDAANLYVAFDCKEPDGEGIVEKIKTNGGNITADDCVELFLDVRKDRVNYIHFAVNAGGCMTAEKGCEPGKTEGIITEAGWSSSWEARTKKEAGSWSCEMKIPFKDLGLGVFTAADWGFNVVRRRQQHGVDPAEYSALTSTRKFFNFAANFYTLTVGYDVPLFAKEEYKVLSKDMVRRLIKMEPEFSKAGLSKDKWKPVGDQIKFTKAQLYELDKRTAEIDYSKGKRAKFMGEFKTLYSNLKMYEEDLEKITILMSMSSVPNVYKATFGAAVVDPGKKVKSREKLGAYVTKKARLTLAKNEYEGLQLVVIPLWNEIPEISITADDLKAATGAGMLDKSNITVSVLGAVKTKPSDSGAETFGWTYDILFKSNKFQLKDSVQPVWVGVYAPKDTKAGIYTGNLNITAGTESEKIELTVEVLDFVLPAEPSLKTAFFFGSEQIKKYYGNKPPPDEEAVITETMVKHRLGKVIKESDAVKLEPEKIFGLKYPVKELPELGLPGFTLDHQYVDCRIIFWLMFKENLKDVLSCPAVSWTPNAAMREKFDPMYRVQLSWEALTADGKNGEGNLVYPKGLSSLRLEYIRDGLEDYEYFKILRELFQAKKAKLSPIDIKAAESALDLSSIITGKPSYVKDMKMLMVKREEVGRLIEVLSKK